MKTFTKLRKFLNLPKKRNLNWDEKTTRKFLAPQLKLGENHVKGEDEYGLIIGNDNLYVGYHRPTGKYIYEMDKEFQSFALKMIKSKKQKAVESDNEYDWYLFLNGYGNEENIKDYFKSINRDVFTKKY